MTTTISTPPERVFALALGAVSSYDATAVTPSTHIEQYAREHKLVDDASTLTIVREVLLGIERYARLLRITIDGFYQRYSGDLIRDDATLYTVFTYLHIFRSSTSISSADLRSMVSHYAHNHPLLTTLLVFLYKECLSSDWLPTQWSLVYDRQYVDDSLLSGMRAHAHDVLAHVRTLTRTNGGNAQDDNDDGDGDGDENSNNGNNKKEKRRRQRQRRRRKTAPRPFNLTKTAALASLSRRRAQQSSTSVTLAATTSRLSLPAPPQTSTTLAELEAAHAERLERIRAETQQRHAQARAPRLTSKAAPPPPPPPMQTMPKARPAPVVVAPTTPTRYTTADILRMDARIRRKQEKEAAVIRAYESELRDTNEFDAWQCEMRERDERARLLEVEQRRVEMSQSAADAQRAVQVHLEQKRVEVDVMRRATEAQLAAKQHADADDLERARERASLMQVAREQAAAAAQTHVLREKKKQAAKVVAERKAASRRAEKRRRKEMKEKKALIVEIQAMERIASEKARRPKLIDPSATSGLGLMGEMSLIELRERLVHLKLKHETEVRDKRRAIVRDMEAKKRMLEAKLRNVQGFMQLQHDSKKQQQQQKQHSLPTVLSSSSLSSSSSSSSAALSSRSVVSGARRRAALALVQRIKTERAV